jgi:hypothetical protein
LKILRFVNDGVEVGFELVDLKPDPSPICPHFCSFRQKVRISRKKLPREDRATASSAAAGTV